MTKKKRSLRANEPHQIITSLGYEETLERIDAYLRLLGYHPFSRNPLIYERGRSFSQHVRSSPRGLKNQCLITLSSDVNQDTIVTVSMKPFKEMEVLFASDWDFWNAEIEGLKTALIYGYVDVDTSRMAAERAQWISNALQMALLALPAVVCGIISFLEWVTGGLS